MPRRDRRQRGHYNVGAAIPPDLLARIRRDGVLYVESASVYEPPATLLEEESARFIDEYFRGYWRGW